MKPSDLKEHIKKRITVNSKGCWVWNLSLSRGGYAQTNIEGKSWRVHRLSYTVYKGKIPEKLQLDHLCRVRNCVNPNHLEAVSAKENLARSPITYSSINKQKKVCKRGHPFKNENLKVYNYKGSVRRICVICHKDISLKRYKLLDDKAKVELLKKMREYSSQRWYSKLKKNKIK